jgi:hypothetical protein
VIAFGLMVFPFAYYWNEFKMNKDEFLSLVLSNGNKI